MKTFKIFSVLALSMTIALSSIGQSVKTESFRVSGNCGMCKSKIEKAAKDAGATVASWNVETKSLTVSYNSASTNAAKIQQKIAAVGYDNAGAKATDDSYNKLHGCCKYDRTAGTDKDKAACCSGDNEKCCTEDKDCCKNHGDDAKADCCKDGKCAKEGEGASCCKKAD